MEVKSVDKQNELYPKNLAAFSSAPQNIYYMGDISILNNPSIAVIGKRDVSEKELRVSRDVGQYLASKGYVVVNGLALGCDSAAIEGSLSANGKVVAVLPCGLDDIHPAQNKNLALRIVENGGCLISEYPNGTKPEKYRYIERDNIQSMISDATCVIATEKNGGTMHTVRYSIKNGKNIVCFWDKVDKNREGNTWLIDSKISKPFSTQLELLNAIY